MIKRLMRLFLLSCLKATQLIEKKHDTSLSYIEFIQLKAHKQMCNACRNYEKQSTLIDKAIYASINKTEIPLDVEALKESINDKIKNLR